MALWGTADSLYSIGTVGVDYANKTITGSGTSFTAAGISTGDVITIGTGGTFGSAVISGITSDTVISIATTQYLTGASISGASYVISEKPVYVLEDSNYSSNVVGLTSSVPKHDVYGVDQYEIASFTPGQSDLAVQMGGIHAGWVGVHTYVDMHGNLRVKSETLVAMSEITSGSVTYTTPGDAGDDAVLPDRYITITTQPVAVGIATTGSGTFSVTAAATPTASLSYQWEVSANGGITYSNATGGIYSNDTTATLTITNPTTASNNRLHRVHITATGGASVYSSAAKLTVTA